MAIRIVTDSTAYTPADVRDRYDIRVVPLKVMFGERAFRDGIDLGPGEFYSLLARSPRLPTTSQPSVGEFQAVYAELAAAGHEIISIHLSAGLSGTWESARAAAALMPDARIHVVDSRTTSLALDMLVRRAAAAASAGKQSAEILAGIERMAADLRLLFVVDTLEYLEKGGRIGPARALLGTLLKIKPVLCVDGGLVKPFASVRTKRKALALLMDHLVEETAGRPVIAGAIHCNDPDQLQQLKADLQAHLNCEEVLTAELSPVIGTHVGPGTLGAAVCPLDSCP